MIFCTALRRRTYQNFDNMNNTHTQHLKGLLAVEDISDESVRIQQDRCYTLQHYAYECRRNRNERGVPYGNTGTSLLVFTVRVSDADSCAVFYQALKSHIVQTFSFLFNATFTSGQQLNSYENAFAARGYVVDVVEDFQSFTDVQMTVTVKLLLNSIYYVGRDVTKHLHIAQ